MRFILSSFVALALLVSGFVAAPAPAQAAGLTESQIQAIISLVASFGADATTISNVSASLRGQATTGSSSTGGTTASGSACIALSFDLYLDRSDAQTNGEVTKLQQFLAQNSSIYPEARITGYFGPATERAVQRWQSMKGVVSSGDADTTGYGYVGPKTRAALACGGTTSNTNTYNPTPSTTNTNTKSTLVPDTLKIVSPSSDTTIGVGQKITISYSVGGNIVANDPAIVERKIVKAGTDTMNSGYVPVSVSAGTYTFDWTPNEAGTYQAVLSITHNNTTYPARSAVITVGSGNTTPTNNSTPSITFSYVSSGNVIGSYTNLPANSQIRFVNTSTGQAYTAQSTMVWGGGNGQLSITVPNDLPNGTYYLRVTDYYNPNTTIAQSASFQAGANVQTSSVVINSFTATPSSVNAGGAVMFMWSSNLTQNDVSYYGGGCSIEGITQNNVAVYVTSGFKGASGQITFVPPATATYTLRCTSNAKDGSPSASRQVTVNVAQPQTNPVVISSFTASKTSVSSGQSVTFSWNSNLTSNDISYYGGFCNIEGLGNNTALYVSAGQTSGASGSITYTPAFTATYTLRCSAGGKDGSPMDSKQVTVNVN